MSELGLMSPPPPARTPALGDPVVVAGTKYRIRTLTPVVARLHAFGGQSSIVDPRTLRWDAGATAWRTDRCTLTR